MQTEQLLCWSGMTDTEHSKTSNSNEEAQIPFSIFAAEPKSNGKVSINSNIKQVSAKTPKYYPSSDMLP